MPLFNTALEEIGLPKNQVLILHPTTIDEITSHQSRRSPMVRYVISMFRIENNNSIRPRRSNRPSWNESFNNKPESYSIFRFGGSSQKVEIPLSVPMENISETSPSTKRNWMQSLYARFEEYFSNSTLHGLRYVGDPQISFGERLFWLCSFISAICFATYFIASLYTKYNDNPVIMSLNPKLTPVDKLPFPAITICNMNQVKRLEAERILNEGTDVEKVLLDDYCNMNSTSSIDLSTISDEYTKWDNVLKFILRVNPSCQEMLKVCFWRQEERDCNFLFNNVLTDEGLCCTFNSLPRELIFRNSRELSDLNNTFPPEVDDWNPERGYAENATPSTLPFKASGAGTHLGLSVVLDAAIHAYYCSSTSSVGFKILLHNSIETPKMADYAFLVPPGMETRISIVPKIFDATTQLRDIDILKRLCFYANERQLQFYRTYTERNCKLECQTNYTLHQCGCVPFHLPKNKNIKICGKKREQCSYAAKITMETNSNGTSCNCLPGCFELGFDSRATYGQLTDAFKVKDTIIKNESVSYFINNMSVIHFHFVESQFVRNTKSVLYGFSEFLSNTGGLLGLFLGFSFLSAVEVAYYLSLRIVCSFMRSRNKKPKQNKKGHPVTNPGLVYPFAK